MSLPLIYHEDYSPAFPPDHRFPMDKFRLLHDHLIDTGLTTDAQLFRPQVCPDDILALAHEPSYIRRYMDGDLSATISADWACRGAKIWPDARYAPWAVRC
jgi:acetoin utilization deacetylase AcuC-like enzyme